MKFPFDVVILAGGSGSRLRSQVADRPKCLAEINQRPFLSYLLDQLVQAEFHTVTISTGYMAQCVEDAFGPVYRSLKLLYSPEQSPSGTGGGVRQALHLCHHDYLLVMNGDSYTDLDLADYLAWFDPSKMDMAMALVLVDNISRFGEVKVGPDDAILKFEEKSGLASIGWINAGIYLIKRSLLERFSSKEPFSLERDLFPQQIGRSFYAHPYDVPFIDIGTPESYASAPAFFANRSVPRKVSLPSSENRP